MNDQTTGQQRDCNEFSFVVDRGYYAGETFVATCRNGWTQIADSEDGRVVSVDGEHDAAVCVALVRAYEQGREAGKSVGRLQLQAELRDLLGAASEPQ